MEVSINNQAATTTLEKALDCIQGTLEELGIVDEDDDVWLFYQNDGQDIDAPENWKEMITEEARKRNWKSYCDV
jgi:hypothetical protein